MTTDDDRPAQAAPKPVLGREPKVMRKRFYAAVSVVEDANQFIVHLDGRLVRTPRKLPLALPVRGLAEAIASEWAGQGQEILPSTMPMTMLACTAIDAVQEQMPAVADEIARYASSDLLCYRSDSQPGLKARQMAGWDPIIAWAEGELKVLFTVTDGLMPVTQMPAVATAMRDSLAPLNALELSAMHVLTTISGSALLALAILRRRLSLDEAWTLAHLDEDWQIAQWGTDAEAEARRQQRYVTAKVASQVLAYLPAQ
jgi:chaperone required for assembly of F1-ATPase